MLSQNSMHPFFDSILSVIHFAICNILSNLQPCFKRQYGVGLNESLVIYNN